MGLYGMGGVGKTTLLKSVNNKFLNSLYNYNVIWVVVSKDHTLEKIQNDIGDKIGYADNTTWKMSKNYHKKAVDIFNVFSKKKFVLLLDDIWERIDLVKVGVSLPDRQNGSKLIFTTRSKDVCFRMRVDKRVEVKCLEWDKSWTLFEEMVGEEALNLHPEIPNLAETVAKECGGLPLALITIGRAMACKRTPQEWKHAIQVLKNSASEFSGMGDEVFPLLKYSYDNLSSEKVRSCFLYCALFPEDHLIDKDDLIDLWIGEGFLDRYVDISGARDQGFDIIGSLLYACLLEESEYYNCVKMHDVIRDMALWIACGCGKTRNSFLVQTKSQLLELPPIEEWNDVRRLSLMENGIETLSGTPTCPNLITLLLRCNNLHQITDCFFEFMPKLRVLDLSYNTSLTHFPGVMISKLVSLQLLDMSGTGIEELPRELSNLVLLKYLYLRSAIKLDMIPQEVISSFSRLQVLDMFYCGTSEKIVEDSVQCGGNDSLVRELECLKHLNALTVSIKSVSAFGKFLSSKRLVSCTKGLLLQHLSGLHFINMSSLVNLKHLYELDIRYCNSLEELKIGWDWERTDSLAISPLQLSVIPSENCFQRLGRVTIEHCHKLKDLTWIVFTPNLYFLSLTACFALEEIISVNKLGDALKVTKHVEPFVKLCSLLLYKLPRLKNIYSKLLPFRCLKYVGVSECVELKKLPIDPNITRELKLIIKGEESWWNELEWDEATRDAFRPCFQAFY